MIAQLYALYGFIEQSIKVEHDYLVKSKLEAKLKAISILLESLPYGEGNIITKFERELK